MFISHRMSRLLFVVCLASQFGAVQAADTVQFNVTELPEAREGYVTLRWNNLPSASEYQLKLTDGQTVYRGAQAEAFISGLRDGTYKFQVVALNENGDVIASSVVPAIVQVQHWSLTLTGLLFACGLMVFVAIIGLIVVGTARSPSSAANGEQGEAL